MFYVYILMGSYLLKNQCWVCVLCDWIWEKLGPEVCRDLLLPALWQILQLECMGVARLNLMVGYRFYKTT